MHVAGRDVYARSSRQGVTSCVYFFEMEVTYAVEIGEFMAIQRCTSRMEVLHCLNSIWMHAMEIAGRCI
jgi:hypothetical protein